MRILHGLEALGSFPPGAVLSVGNFDGMHRGHRKILETMEWLAKKAGAGRGVVTFEPHPLTVLRPALAPPRLTPPEIKQKLLAAAGVETLVILPPAADILKLTAEEFWKILRDQARPAHLVEGASFRFGAGAAGNVEKLKKWAADSSVGLTVVESVSVPLLDLQLVPVSSSLIRFLLSWGRVRDAAICLGRGYQLIGRVEPGAGRGKTIGIPTANLHCEDQMIPAEAVYAGRTMVEGQTFSAAISIGPNPTFGDNSRKIEAHLIDYSGELYGKSLQIELLDWLREHRKFSGGAALKKQILADVARTRLINQKDPSRPIAVRW